MSKLLYHRPLQSTAVSPFDEAVLLVARSGPLRIACPYIGIGYLLRALSLNDDWRLISDVQEWLTVLPRLARPKAWQFIREHLDRIHHYRDLHSKVVVGSNAAMFGSANLTQRGILGRAEMGMLIHNPAQIAELAAWFDALWDETAPLAVDEANAFIQWLDEQAEQSPARRQQFAFSNQGRRIRAKLVKLAPAAESVSDADAALSLDVMAQELVAEEQTHFDTVEEAFAAVLDSLTGTGGFMLSDAVAAVRRRFAGAEVREVYALVLRHCANHARSVFAEGTLNRLVLDDGRFTRSTRETLTPALDPFDSFLLRLIRMLSFGFAQGLPIEDVIERETGIPGRDQVLLVAEMLEVGLLGLEDIPGELPHYRLEREFEWPGRFGLFTKAHAAWKLKAEQAVVDAELRSQRDAEDDEDSWLDALSEDSIPEAVEGSDGSFTFEGLDRDLRQGREQMRELIAASGYRTKGELNEANRVRRRERREAIDGWLAYLVRLMAEGNRFIGPDFMSLVNAAAVASGVDETLAQSVLDPNGEGPRVFNVTQEGGGSNWALDINPALTWDMLKKYPKTKAACEMFLAKEQ